jgi:threonine aldolase
MAKYFHQVAYTLWQSVGELFTKARPLSLQGRYNIMDDLGFRQWNFVSSLIVSLSTALSSVSVHLNNLNE